MKSAVADYRYRVLCLRIVPVYGGPIYLTDHPVSLVMGAHTYLSTAGYQFTGYDSRSDFSPASIDLEGIAGAAGLSRATISSGIFDGARCYVFATSFVSPVEDEEPIVAGVFGKTVLLDDRFQIGGVSLIDAIHQTIGQTYGAQCPKKFGGTEYAGCGVPLAPNTTTGTLTFATSASVFGDHSRAEADDTFGGGTIEFLSGPAVGLKPLEIKSYVGKTITTFEPFYYPPNPGDSYRMVRGCRKRLEDCKLRWNGTANFSNVANFGGFLHIPVGSTYAQVGRGEG